MNHLNSKQALIATINQIGYYATIRMLKNMGFTLDYVLSAFKGVRIASNGKAYKV